LLPYLLAADDFLWRRWTHWFETMSGQKVIAPIPQIQWARNEAGFKMLDRCLGAISKYGDWRGWGNWSAFDYLIDWLLYGFGHKGQPKVTLVNGFLYAPWLVRPFPFLDAALIDPGQSRNISDSIARQAPLQLHCTEHDAAMQWQFELIKKRRKSGQPSEQYSLLPGL
jgi:hypothetical protein